MNFLLEPFNLFLFENFKQFIPFGATSATFRDASKWVSMHYSIPLIACSIYLIAIPVLQQIMKNREALKLTLPLAIWNLSLSLFSLIGVINVFPMIFSHLVNGSLHSNFCVKMDQNYGNSHRSIWLYFFLYSKFPELLDTLFLILRKKDVDFLQWYHHTTVLLFCWQSMATLQPIGVYFCGMNYFVHAVMYFYFFLMATGIRVRWGKWVTVLQITQMIIGLILHFLGLYMILTDRNCTGADLFNLTTGTLMYFSYFLLFLSFFAKRWEPKKTTKTE